MTMVEPRTTHTAQQASEFVLVVEDDLASGQWPPATLIDAYVRIAHAHRRSEQMEDGRWFAEVVGLEGAWADGDTRDEAEEELLDVLQGWVELKIEAGDDDIPPMEGIDLRGI